MTDLKEDYIERIWAEAKLLYLEESEELIPTLITLAYSDGMDAEREACAKFVEDWSYPKECAGCDQPTPQQYAQAIRARGET